MAHNWTDAQTKRLLYHMRAGQTARQTAKHLTSEFNVTFNKNMVIGRWTRFRHRSETTSNRKMEKSPSMQKPNVSVFNKDAGGEFKRCQYMHGDARDRKFCGKPVVEGTSWCAEHYPQVFDLERMKKLKLKKIQRQGVMNTNVGGVRA